MMKVLPWVLLLIAATVYAWRLGEMPTYISPDEAIIAVDAHAVATTGNDGHGTTMPLYFFIQMPKSERTGWFTPVIFYLSAAVQLVLPFNEWSVRVPSVLVGMADLILIYWLGLGLFGNRLLALAAAGLLAVAPAHFIFSRYALDYLYPVPFLLAWLISVQRALATPSTRRWLACGLWLGVCFYSYAAAILLTPLLVALTCLVVITASDHWKRAWPVVAGYAIPLTLFIAWFIAHPGAFTDTAARYSLYDSSKLNALQGLREFLSFYNIERMVSIYWSFFNPSFLFMSGDQLITYSTRQAGAFPMIMALLMPLGLVQIVERERHTFAWLVVAGFLLAPLPAVVVSENGAMNRATALLPFGVLIATYGLKFLVSWAPFGRRFAPVRQSALTAAVVLLVALLQFSSFTRDYFGDYRIRINSWLGGNLRGALEAMIERQPPGGSSRVYFAHLQAANGLADIRNYFMDAYWRFYLIKHHRGDLLDRTALLDPAALAQVPDGSLVLGNKGDRVIDSLVASGRLAPVASIPELDRDSYFVILEKRGS